MKLLTYKFFEPIANSWNFSEVTLGKINLLVGNTGSGKTRFLNTLFNIGTSVANETVDLVIGHWEVNITVQNSRFFWLLEVNRTKDDIKPVVTKELLVQSSSKEKKRIIIDRNINKFSFCDKKMPKLSPNKSGLTLLKNEDIINPINKGFASILRRHFSMDALLKASQYVTVPDIFLQNKKSITIEDIFWSDFPLNINLFLLSQFFPKKYELICNNYKLIFPFIENIEIKELTDLHKFINISGRVPVFCIKEKGSTDWVELKELSSGMQKVLLIITDFYILPNEGVYLLDEYENSLGPNAIDFLPEFLNQEDNNNQYIITSHHPYIISNIPIKNWYVFHRVRKKVNILFGSELIQKYGKSKQDAFSQLINDPFYIEGIE